MANIPLKVTVRMDYASKAFYYGLFRKRTQEEL